MSVYHPLLVSEVALGDEAISLSADHFSSFDRFLSSLFLLFGESIENISFCPYSLTSGSLD